MKKLLVSVIMVLLLTAAVAMAQTYDQGHFEGLYGIDLWGLGVSVNGPYPAAHYYLPGKLYQNQIRNSFNVVRSGPGADLIDFEGTWMIVYYLNDYSVATAIMLPQ